MGDSNTNFFHSLAFGRRNQNAIWSLEDSDGNSIDDEDALKILGFNHFSQVFSNDKQTCLLAQLKVVILFPSMIPPEEAHCLVDPVMLSEIEGALKAFKKDRSLGPDGWPVEFFLHFFKLLGKDLLAVVDFAKISGHITLPLTPASWI